MQEFDFPGAIKRLAEAEWKCPGVVHASTPPPGPISGQSWCIGSDGRVYPSCGGTGYIVPFVALRVQCYSESYPEFCARGEALCNDPEYCNHWIPEPDVEKACWRIEEDHPEIASAVWPRKEFGDYTFRLGRRAPTRKEAVIRAAEAWQKEQNGQ